MPYNSISFSTRETLHLSVMSQMLTHIYVLLFGLGIMFGKLIPLIVTQLNLDGLVD